METILILVLNIVVILVAVLIFVFRRRKISEANPELERLENIQIIPPDGIRVPITFSFTGLRPFGGVLGFSRNNLNPKLTLFDDRMEYRVVLKGSKRYGDIEQVKARGGRELVFYFYSNLLTLTIYAADAEDRITLLNFLRSRGVSLDEKARALVNGERGI